MRSPIADRIEKILHFKSITATEFADKLGIQRSSISHIMSGRNKPSLDLVRRIIQAYPDVSYAWLIDGMEEKDFDSKEQIVTNVNNQESDSPKPVIEKKEQKKSVQPKSDGRKIDRIVIFYKNGEFETYSPTS